MANILKGTCSHECRTTFAVEHGASVPGGPFPGTGGSIGDVRRCAHGRLWIFESNEGRFDYWRKLSRFFEPLVCRRARRALEADGA